MKKRNKLFTVLKNIVLFTLVFSTILSLVACSNDSSDDNTADSFKKPEYQRASNHVYNAPETDDYLVESGKTDYVLVAPDTVDVKKYYYYAKKEFTYFFKEATGITIVPVPESALTWNENQKVISLGDNAYTKSAGINVNKLDLGTEGGRIETKGKSIFIYGNTPMATLYAVYSFFTLEFNFECYFSDCYEIDTGILNFKLKNYDVTEIPDIEHRDLGYSILTRQPARPTYDSEMFRYRFRTKASMYHDYLLQIHELSTTKKDNPNYDKPDAEVQYGSRKHDYHNAFDFFPKAVYQEDHPKFFSTDGKQVCLTARGDAKELALMKQLAARSIIDMLQKYTPEEYPYIEAVTVCSQQDGGGHCNCSACSEVRNRYFSETYKVTSLNAATIMFVNDVSDIVEEWMAKEENAAYRRDLRYLVMNYGDYEDCPVKYNEDLDKYEPIDELVTPREKVGAFLCHLYTGSQTGESFLANNEKSIDAYNKIRGWADICDYIVAYQNNLNTGCYFAFYDTFSLLNNESYVAFANLGIDINYLCTQDRGDYAITAFYGLKCYLDAKLGWNANQNTYDLVMKYFKAMYKDAWQEMYEYFEDVRMFSKDGMAKDQGFTVDGPKSWSQSIIQKYLDLFDKAKAKLEKYKDIDMDLYNKTINHLDIEWVTPAYQAIEWYPNYYSDTQMHQLKKHFRYVVEKNGITALTHYNNQTIKEKIATYPES